MNNFVCLFERYRFRRLGWKKNGLGRYIRLGGDRVSGDGSLVASATGCGINRVGVIFVGYFCRIKIKRGVVYNKCNI